MRKYLTWTCPKCGKHDIACEQNNMVVQQNFRLYREGKNGSWGRWYGRVRVPEFGDQDAMMVRYFCPHCNTDVIEVSDGGEYEPESLVRYLESLPENREESK